MSCPPPIVGAALWQAVMDRASQGQDAPRCQCTGQCGQPHIKGAGRCPRTHGQHMKGRGPIRLSAAPANPAIEGTTAAGLPVEALRAWCPTCFDGARREARKHAETTGAEVLTTMEGLF